MAKEEVRILLDGEELPTSEQVRYMTVDILSQEERLRIAELQAKVEKLLESGVLTNEVSSRLDLVFASLEKMAERIDGIKRPYDLDIVIDDVKGRLSDMAQELDILSSAISKKLDSSLQRFGVKTDAVADSLSSLAHLKGDVRSAVSDLESYGQSMESVRDNLRNFLNVFDRKLEELGRTSDSLSVMKEEVEMSIGSAAERMRSEVESLSSAVSDFVPVKDELAALQGGIKETNIKLSILIDSVEQKVFELTSVFDNVENIESGIESQTGALKNIADFMKEFIDHAQESSVRLGNTIADFSAFRDRVNDEVKKVLDLVDERTGMLDVASRELSSLRSQLETRFEDLDSIKADLSEAVYGISRNAPVMEKAAADILDVHSLVSASADRLESATGSLEKMAQQSGDFLAAQKAAAAELKSASAAVDKSTKAISSLQEDLEDTVKSVDRKTDDILNVFIKKVADLEKVVASLEKNSGASMSASARLENLVDKIASLPQARAVRRKRAKRKAKPVLKPKPKVRRARRAVRSVARRKVARKRRPRRRVARRRAARTSLRRLQQRRQMEEEALDLLIVDTLKNVSMNIGSLENATKVSESRLRKRLNVLIARGVVAAEKRGRSIYYVSRVEQATEGVTG